MISLLVPHDGRAPRVSWPLVADCWQALLPDVEVVVGTDHGEPFSRSAALNDAAACAKGDLYVVTDADTFWPEAPFVIARVRAGVPWGMAALTCRLSEQYTARALEGARFPPRHSAPVLEGAAYRASGGCLVVPRALWRTVGGFDPRFRGWGSEDTAFMAALETFGGRPLRYGHQWHLWHPRIGNGIRKTWAGQTAEHSAARDALRERYQAARGDRAAMGRLIDEHA